MDIDVVVRTGRERSGRFLTVPSDAPPPSSALCVGYAVAKGQGPKVKTRKKYDPKIPTKTPNTKPAKKRNNSNLRTPYGHQLRSSGRSESLSWPSPVLVEAS